MVLCKNYTISETGMIIIETRREEGILNTEYWKAKAIVYRIIFYIVSHISIQYSRFRLDVSIEIDDWKWMRINCGERFKLNFRAMLKQIKCSTPPYDSWFSIYRFFKMNIEVHKLFSGQHTET